VLAKQKVDKVKIVCLGNYPEFGMVRDVIRSMTGFVDMVQIWHPAYLARYYTAQKFKIWIKSYGGKGRRLL